MTATLMQFSAVVVGESHNSLILNPDFLAAQDIVPAELELASDPDRHHSAVQPCPL